ncbi:uncharacterized protein LOC129586034 [Paramacrobiotus metropolitanus]|uniref:uncharacterized protein LOC129586034 n=1 Tax=Paramacrobiotus metropolitanus TaxID=2943436 RepID=UPI0024459D82|nr:uncharacterized protein LOC129586034 [Paramacrobiotus metropolitanus]
MGNNSNGAAPTPPAPPKAAPDFRPTKERIMRRIPHGARPTARASLQRTLLRVASQNDSSSWLKLLAFAPNALRLPAKTKSERAVSLATAVKKNLDLFDRDIEIPASPPPPPLNPKKKRNSQDDLVRQVGLKIDDGSVSGAMRVISSTDSVAAVNADVLDELRTKHPKCTPPIMAPLDPGSAAPPISAADVFAAIHSFPRGSAAGPDGLRPQHLLDIVGPKMDVHSSQFCEALASVLNIVVNGKIPSDIRPTFFGGKLIALRKKDGGLRPIAVGLTLRRIVAKIVCTKVADRVTATLCPLQLGFNIRGGAEAIVHGTRKFAESDPETVKAILKIDFRNAFNTVSREAVLNAAHAHFPEYSAFLQSAYGYHSSLFLDQYNLSSESGVQQGDPLGPLLFCLVLHLLVITLTTELNAWFLDDGTLGGSPASVLANFDRIIAEAHSIGLDVNIAKCELFVCGGTESNQQHVTAEFNASGFFPDP